MEFWNQMAGGMVRAKKYPGETTPFVLVTCLIAATGGLIFGFDIGISGGVTSMDSFLVKFFPEVFRKMKRAETDDYCKFENQVLTMFTSSLYIAALMASFIASAVTRSFGRRPSMVIGGASFLVGAALNGTAVNVAMLILGRIMLGIGVGFANQSIPLYLSEMAPSHVRGALNIGFQQFITVGILCANLLNYGTAKIHDWGWRVSLALAAVPGLIITVGSLNLSDTPNSLIERGHPEKGRAMLEKIRGTTNVQAEFDELMAASEASKNVKHPLRNILKPEYRPQLIMSVAIPFFQQFTGINVIMFYAPVLFKAMGFGNNGSLVSAVVGGLVNVAATFVSVFGADKFGRRSLFLEGGIQMFICQIVVAALIGVEFGSSGEGSLSKRDSILVLVFICCYVAAYAWSWGPLGWLIPSEIFPLEIRSAGQSITVCVNMLFTFIIAQAFLPMLCRFKYGLFLFFAGWVAIMTLFIYLFLPETKGVHIEDMATVWRRHWFWGRNLPVQSVDEPTPNLDLELPSSTIG